MDDASALQTHFATDALDLDGAIGRASAALLGRQRPVGHFLFELEAALLEVFGVREDQAPFAGEPVTQVDGGTGRVVLAPEFFDGFGRVAASRGIRKTTSDDSGPALA